MTLDGPGVIAAVRRRFAGGGEVFRQLGYVSRRLGPSGRPLIAPGKSQLKAYPLAHGHDGGIHGR